ncbi:hypothetical protein ACFYPB_43460 [Streptomyces olivaceoviridis]|uniref:hypothetical protein n=1 Tax=Streptomyces olivaceoviridis TaxID=1921 RepID=UPI0036B4214B
MSDLELQDLEEVFSLKAIMCVTGPSALQYTTAVTRAFSAVADKNPETLWVGIQPPGDRTTTVQSMYDALNLEGVHGPRPRRLADAEDLIVAELTRTPRLVVVLGAHELRTVSLEMLYGMWAHLVPGHFGLALAGQSGKLEKVLDRPALASLKSCVFLRHRVVPEPA